MHAMTHALMSSTARWDKLGIVATSLCALHCLLLPLLLPLATATGLSLLVSASAERVVLLTTLIFACVVLAHGCRHHHNRWPLVLAAVGGALYAFKGQFGHELEPMMVVAGASLIVGAHLWNLRLCRHCAHHLGDAEPQNSA